MYYAIQGIDCETIYLFPTKQERDIWVHYKDDFSVAFGVDESDGMPREAIPKEVAQFYVGNILNDKAYRHVAQPDLGIPMYITLNQAISPYKEKFLTKIILQEISDLAQNNPHMGLYNDLFKLYLAIIKNPKCKERGDIGFITEIFEDCGIS